ncbi:MAG: T9SS type A sorting domain-containing protein [Flavobacteriales bacterium]|nr:T9SS type A sorting domain-containing protein [Flavobacteriales bacterium]MCB9194390.1 T9SS type A sorting domain-containing protein [Flavobacteriales bacterium]
MVRPSIKHLLTCATYAVAITSPAQFLLHLDQSIPVTRNGSQLHLAWSGGLNFCQFSPIDLDGDGDQDIFVFDRSGDEVLALINDGGPGQIDYHYDPELSGTAPFNDLQEWALLRDYNCDGKADIFTYTIGGFAVWKNISGQNDLEFQLVDTLVRSNYVPQDANLYVTQVDLPGIADIDGDGDLDILTFSIFGSYEEYHKNLSMELYGTCDSLEFEVRNRCWGSFYENLNNNSVTLNAPCQFNVPDPEMPVAIERLTAETRAAGGRPDHDGASDTEGSRAHTGSTTMVLDLDGNGVMDIVLGDVSYNTLVALYNGGTVDNSFITDQDTVFPVYDVPAEMPIFPGAFYLDVDNDGLRDMLVSPDGTSLAQNHQSVWFYKNIGADDAPVFQYQMPDLFQRDMIDVGEGAYPVLFDHNGDGLMDLVIANYGYYEQGGDYPSQFALLENVGTATQPAFELVDEDWQDMSGSGIGNGMYPTFGDLDGDGDKDMLVGSQAGFLYYYENIATGPVAAFQLSTLTVPNDQGQAIDVGLFATPQLFDMDGDGLLDLVIGERNGNLNYYRNAGTATDASWHFETDSLGHVNVTEWWSVTGYSVPFMYLNSDGERELLVGSESGWVHHYKNIDGNLTGTFTQLDSAFQGIKEGRNSSIALYDIDSDGHLDAFTGNYRGGIGFWHNDIAASIPGQDGREAGAFVSPNPTDGRMTIVVRGTVGPKDGYRIFDVTGALVAQGRLTGDRTMVDLSELGQGVYIVRLRTGTMASGPVRVVLTH